MKSQIVFTRNSYDECRQLMKAIESCGIIYATRGDELAVASNGGMLDSNDIEFFVIVRTQNIRGMIEDLEDNRFM